LIAAAGFDPMLCADTFAEGFDFYLAREDVSTPELAEYVALNPGSGRLWPDLTAAPPPGAFTGFAMGTQAQMVALEERLQRELPGRLSTHVLRSPRYTGYMCELSPAGVTKWSGVCRLADAWGIPTEAICAVGDDVNDIPMIRGAGLGVAMGNALPAVKAAADRVVSSHDEDGLVQVVEWLLRARKETG
jgi:5-amino-6-(5-phospho-D-ribitylamino)uracil phosphatase